MIAKQFVFAMQDISPIKINEECRNILQFMSYAALTHTHTHTHYKMFDRAVGVTVWSHRIVALRYLGDGPRGGVVQMTWAFGTNLPAAMRR